MYMEFYLSQPVYARALEKGLAKKQFSCFFHDYFTGLNLKVQKVKNYLPKKIVILEFCVIVNRLKSVPSREINCIFPYTGTRWRISRPFSFLFWGPNLTCYSCPIRWFIPYTTREI